MAPISCSALASRINWHPFLIKSIKQIPANRAFCIKTNAGYSFVYNRKLDTTTYISEKQSIVGRLGDTDKRFLFKRSFYSILLIIRKIQAEKLSIIRITGIVGVDCCENRTISYFADKIHIGCRVSIIRS